MFLQAVEFIPPAAVQIPAKPPVNPAWHPGKYDAENLVHRGAWKKFRDAFARLSYFNLGVLMDRIEQATPATGHESPRFLAEAAIWHFTRLHPDAQKRLTDEWYNAGQCRLDAEQIVLTVFGVQLVWDDFDYAGRIEVRFDAVGNVSAVALSRHILQSDSFWTLDFERCLKAMRDKLASDPTLDRSDSLFGRIDI